MIRVSIRVRFMCKAKFWNRTTVMVRFRLLSCTRAKARVIVLGRISVRLGLRLNYG